MKKTNRWKHVSAKKRSARERGIFVSKQPCAAGGLEFTKEGCCFMTNDVICASGYSDLCFECATYKRVMAEMEEQDIKIDAEIEDEMYRRGLYK
jgi:hypothetical protein